LNVVPLTVYEVEDCISKLKRGNAPGVDLLSVEHIVNCHPIVIIQLTCMYGLYSRSKSSNSELVSIELVKSFCLPVLLYGIEVTDVFNMLNNLINRAVHKILW